MFEDAIGCSSEGEDSVKAEAELAEIASIVAPATTDATPPFRMRVNMSSSFSRHPRLVARSA